MTWPERGLSRRWFWAQLAAGVVLLMHAATDVALVRAHVSCAVYRKTIGGWPGEAIAYSSLVVLVVSFLVRLIAQLSARVGRRAILLALGIFALELALIAGAIVLAVDQTLLYCAFDGVRLNACEMGLCAR